MVSIGARADNELMLIVALVLVLLVAVFGLVVALSNQAPVQLSPSGSINLSVFGAALPISELGLVCAGAGAMLALILAAVLFRVGARRARANRKEQKAMQKAAKNSAAAGSGAQPKPVSSKATASKAAASKATASKAVGPTGGAAATGTSSTSDHTALLDEVDQLTGNDPKS